MGSLYNIFTKNIALQASINTTVSITTNDKQTMLRSHALLSTLLIASAFAAQDEAHEWNCECEMCSEKCGWSALWGSPDTRLPSTRVAIQAPPASGGRPPCQTVLSENSIYASHQIRDEIVATIRDLARESKFFCKDQPNRWIPIYLPGSDSMRPGRVVQFIGHPEVTPGEHDGQHVTKYTFRMSVPKLISEVALPGHRTGPKAIMSKAIVKLCKQKGWSLVASVRGSGIDDEV